MKKRLLVRQAIIFFLIVSVVATPIILAEDKEGAKSPGAFFFEPLMLEPTYNILYNYRIEIYTPKHGKNNSTRIFPLGVYIGNGICIDGANNIYLDMMKLLKVDNSRDYVIKVTYDNQKQKQLIEKIGSELKLKGCKATINGDAMTCTYGLMKETITPIENGFDHQSVTVGNCQIVKNGNSIDCPKAITGNIDGDTVTVNYYTIKKTDRGFILTERRGFSNFKVRPITIEFQFEGNVLKCIVDGKEHSYIVEKDKLITDNMTLEIEYTS